MSMARGRITEKRLVDVLIAHIRSQERAAQREVRHYEKTIDIVFLCPGTEELGTIEAKTTDWSRALSQAIVNLAAGDRSYIAVYAPFVHRVCQNALEEHGIGLIAVGSKWGEVEVLREARLSPYTNRLAANRLRSAVAQGVK